MSEGNIDNLNGLMNDVLNVRLFRSDPLPPEMQEALLEAFRLGPSSANVQPWELVTVASAERRAAVAGATLDPFLSPGSEGAQGWLVKAPFVVVVCLDRPRAQARVGASGWEQSSQDTFAAIQNLRLTAVRLGLKTAVVREFNGTKLAVALNLPFTVEPLALVASGYSDAILEYPPRLELHQILHQDGWSS
jgi:5,6-dimethylbenzimidazole synthase